jgi:protein-L-isoaspartate(D-aspartate) O-methyltransferase
MASRLERSRRRMLDHHLADRGMREPRVLAAMAAVPRERFVRIRDIDHAYEDRPLPIGDGQTISQPYVVALMADLLELTPESRVLEVGSGSGYAAAVLGQLAGEVFGIERFEALAESSRARLADLGVANVHVIAGDGTLGLPAHAPYDAILVSAASPDVPRPLLAQLAPGGRLVVPVGPAGGAQRLLRFTADASAPGGARVEDLGPVAFVPLVAG